MLKQLLLFMILLSPFAIHAQEYKIYVSDAGNFNSPPWKIIRYDEDGTDPETFISQALSWPQDILFLEEDSLVLISNLNTGNITKYNAQTGSYLGVFASGISAPTRMKIGADGLLYVLQWNGSGKVLRYTLSGIFVDEFTDVGIPQSIGLDWDTDGNLYVSSFSGDGVAKFDTDGNFLGNFITSNLLGPTNIWFDNSGDLLVVDYNGTAVKRFDAEGNYKGNFIQGVSNAEGVAFFPNGDILLGIGNTSSVRKYNSSGQLISNLIPTNSGGLMTPNAIVIREVESSVTVPVVEQFSSVTKHPVTPSVGHEFYIAEPLLKHIVAIDVYNLAGTIVHSSRPRGHLVWDASAIPDGIYLLRVLWKSNSISTQKIIVRN